MSTKIFTVPQLAEYLGNSKGAKPVSFVACTDARLKKTNNPFAMPVVKWSRVSGFVGIDYEAAVNRQQVREGGEGNFEAKERQWGEALNRSLVIHPDTGKAYLAVKVERSLSEPMYLDAKGNQLSKEEVKPFLPSKGKPANQETEKEIIIRNYTLDNLKELRIDGQEILIVPTDESVG